MPISAPDLNLRIIAPALIVAISAIVVLLGEIFTPAHQKRWLGYAALVGLAIAGEAALSMWGAPITGFREMIVTDNFGVFLTFTILLGAALSILLSIDRFTQGEYYALMLFSVAGMILMATATDLIVIFLALELLSLPLYMLAAFQRENTKSLEAGLKYFLLGAFSSAFFLYGIALIYGATATTNLARIAQAAPSDLLLIGAGLVLVGFAFKVALVPFHWWTPDVYEGAPTTITAFMSVGVKAAAFGAFFRVFLIALPTLAIDWRVVLAIISVITMTLGNVAALLQSNIKRMLAYSSIAHAGYILIALVAMGKDGSSSALFYLLAYTVTNLGALGAVIALGDKEIERLEIKDFGGVAKTQPFIAALMTIFMLSLAGFPPFGGFVGKFLIFGAAVQNNFAWLAVIGVLNSLISAYFYLRPVVAMYMNDPVPGWNASRVPSLVMIALIIAVAFVIALGILPSPAIAFAQGGLIK
jgi:NADH-quinone oxidoreductase subunit N